MKSLFRNTLVKPGAVIVLAVASMLGGGAAQAAGTASGTPITNQATLAYTVGTTAQTPIPSSPTNLPADAGKTTDFLVDNKVNLTVTTAETTFVSVGPGTTKQVTRFTVTNSGNTTQGYTLVGANTTGTNIAGTADTIDVSNLNVFVEAGTTIGYQLAEDTATSILTLAPDTSKVVYIVADIPALAVNGAQANVSLTATTVVATTLAAVSETAGANTAGVDIVFADAATTELELVGTSAARDGKATARNAYRVASAALTVTKTVTLVCDPLNGNAASGAKNIPGSYVSYTVTIANASTAAASAILGIVSDPLSTALTFDPELIVGATAAGCATGGPRTDPSGNVKVVQTNRSISAFKTSALDTVTDGVTLSGTSPNFSLAVDFVTVLPAGGAYTTAGELKAGESVSVSFQAKIN